MSAEAHELKFREVAVAERPVDRGEEGPIDEAQALSSADWQPDVRVPSSRVLSESVWGFTITLDPETQIITIVPKAPHEVSDEELRALDEALDHLNASLDRLSINVRAAAAAFAGKEPR